MKCMRVLERRSRERPCTVQQTTTWYIFTIALPETGKSSFLSLGRCEHLELASNAVLTRQRGSLNKEEHSSVRIKSMDTMFSQENLAEKLFE